MNSQSMFRVLVACVLFFSVMLEARASDNVRFPADAGIIDVTDPFFGAIPDDGLDDTDALQRVLDLLSPNGKIVYFPNGRYDISRELLLEKKGFRTEAEDLPFTGWREETDGARTFLVAEDVGTGPDDAGRITYSFDAIQASRIMTLTYRVSSDFTNSFYFRVNDGPWQANSRNFNGNSAWREDGVVATNILLETGVNKVEFAVREAGFEIDNIEIAYLGNFLSNVIIQGQETNKTVLRLVDSAVNDDGTPFDGAIIRWESGVAQFFRTAVRNMTLDVGFGNPEADGLKFHGNNQSIIANVRILGKRDSGDVGLDLAHSTAIGPILVRNVAIHGFDIGIHTGWQTASRTFDLVRLVRQREFGWVNEAASTVWISRLISRNSVPAFRNTSLRLPGDGQGRVVLMNSKLRGRPGAETETAISNFGPSFYVKNVVTPGYGTALVNNNQLSFRGFRGQDGIDGEYIGEWWSHGADDRGGGGFTKLFEDTPDTAIGLAGRISPKVVWDDPDTWDGPHNHQILLPSGETSGIPNDGIDDTLSIQAAIDSGAGTVYLPHGNWTLDGTIELRGNVHRFLGTEAGLISSSNDLQPTVIIGETGPNRVFIERLANFAFLGGQPRFEHASRRTVIFNDITGLNYRPTVDRPGQLYINDTVGSSILFKNQRVYARQLNIEEDTTRETAELDAKIINDGAQAWILGFKTENPGVHIKTINGGYTDLLGNIHTNAFGSTTPQYITEDASLSVMTNIQPVVDNGSTYGTVVETRNGETRTGSIEGVGYAAFSNDDLWALRREIILDNDDDSAVYSGDWDASIGFPRGHIGDDFAFALATPDTSVTYTPTLPMDGLYEVYVRWIGDWGGQDHTGHTDSATYTVTHANGSDSFVVNQLDYSDGWHLLGKFSFTNAGAASVVLSGDDATKKINSDGVRFLYTRK